MKVSPRGNLLKRKSKPHIIPSTFQNRPYRLFQQGNEIEILFMNIFAQLCSLQLALCQVQMAFKPKFPCGSSCIAKFEKAVAHSIRSIDMETIDDEEEDHPRRRHSRGAEQSFGDELCLMEEKSIPWKKFVERDLCSQIKTTLPECRGRTDECILCFGNGSYGMSSLFKHNSLKTYSSCTNCPDTLQKESHL